MFIFLSKVLGEGRERPGYEARLFSASTYIPAARAPNSSIIVGLLLEFTAQTVQRHIKSDCTHYIIFTALDILLLISSILYFDLPLWLIWTVLWFVSHQ